MVESYGPKETVLDWQKQVPAQAIWE
jgi:hypothetical protein